MPKDITNTQQFLEIIFGDDWIHAEVCSVPVLGRDKEYGVYWNTRPARDMLRNLDPGWNNYFCVSLMDTPGLRRKENFKALHVLSVDDVGPKVDPALTRATLGEPTYRVETSPGNEHWGYVLDPPVTDLAQADALIDAAIQVLAGGKDPGMGGVTRLMRLPGGTNTKHTPGHKTGATHNWTVKHKPALLAARLGGTTVQRVEPEPFDPFDAAVPGPAPASPGPNRRPVDPTLSAMRKLGLVLGNERRASQGSGWDVRCPWVHEHTPSTAQDTGTMYFRGGGMKCWHGHCQDRKPEDVRARVNQMLSDETGGLFSIDDFDPSRFDAVDPAQVPQSPLPPEPDEIRRFWETTVYLGSEEKFINIETGEEMSEKAFNAYWAPLLRGYPP